MKLFALTLVLLCGLPASAGAFEVLGDDGKPIEPFQTWANESKVPLPKDDYVVVSRDMAPCYDELTRSRGGCQSGNVIVLSVDFPKKYERAAFYHELGHYIDLQYFGHKQNRRYCRITGLPCSRWNGGDMANPGTGEHFADFFRFAAQYGTWDAYAAAVDTYPEFTYGRLPREQTWNAILDTIKSAVAPKKNARRSKSNGR